MSLKDNPDLMNLQKIWYARLKQAGFNDIEDTNSPREYLKVWESTNWVKQYTPEAFQDRAEYYRLAGLFLHEHSFESHYEQTIWQLHSEGKSLRYIEEYFPRLPFLKIKANKETVRKIIQRLVDIMRTHDFNESEYYYS